jgi:molecular chaperone DnaJ
VFCCRAATHPGCDSRRVPGDLFGHVVVETPVNLTERQRQLLREFEAATAQDSARHNPRAKGRFDKVKEFFEG